MTSRLHVSTPWLLTWQRPRRRRSWRRALSNLDQNIAVIVQTVYCFRAADDGGAGRSSACDVLRESLAKVLVHYYPLAGRLAISDDGKLVVDCTGDGAVFVEAEADCAMADIGDVTDPDPSVLGRLVYSVPGAKNILEMPLLAAQVLFAAHLLDRWTELITVGDRSIHGHAR